MDDMVFKDDVQTMKLKDSPVSETDAFFERVTQRWLLEQYIHSNRIDFHP